MVVPLFVKTALNTATSAGRKSHHPALCCDCIKVLTWRYLSGTVWTYMSGDRLHSEWENMSHVWEINFKGQCTVSWHWLLYRFLIMSLLLVGWAYGARVGHPTADITISNMYMSDIIISAICISVISLYERYVYQWYHYISYKPSRRLPLL